MNIRSIGYIIFVTLFLGCNNPENNLSYVSYKEAQLHCQKIKEHSQDGVIDSTEDCMCGSKLPKFNLTTISGQHIQSKDLKGKLTIINFWFTTCPPCIAEIPAFNELVEKYGKKLNFISVARNSKNEIKEFLGHNSWDFNHISNDDNIIDSIFNHQSSYPTTYLLDKDGIIIRSFSGGYIGEYASFGLKKKLVASIEEALRISTKESRNDYPRHIGDIEFLSSQDDESFRLCNSEKQIEQYFNDGNGLQYKGERAEIWKLFKENFKSDNSITDSGLLTLRFVVNCKGETDRFRLLEMDYNFKEINFSKAITDQILSIAKSMKGWQPKTQNGQPIDYYQVISFKIEKGKIFEIVS